MYLLSPTASIYTNDGTCDGDEHNISRSFEAVHKDDGCFVFTVVDLLAS